MGIAGGGLFLAQGACAERGSPALAGCFVLGASLGQRVPLGQATH